MNRRLVSAIAAGLLAVLGAVLLITYVNSADDRAMARMDPVEVMVVSAHIPQGTPAEEIGESVLVEELPRASVGPNPVTSLAELAGQVAATELRPGEQLLAGRFISPQDLQQFGGIPVPEGLHEVTVPLDSPRVVGGTVTPGDLVAVTISLSGEPPRTHMTHHKLLVTRVQGGLNPSASATGDADGSTAASADPAAAPEHAGGAMATLAVNARDAETIVFGAEHGTIWLSRVDPTTPEDGTRIVEPGNVYE